jgi:hypothetical protein
MLSIFAASALCAGSGSAQEASPAPVARNLVTNGDAEANVGAPDSGKVVKPDGWTTTGEFTAVQYGASGGFPTLTTTGPSERGKNFFSGGNKPLSTAKQTIALTSYASAIDAGTDHFVFSAWIGGYASQADYAVVTVTFKSSGNATLGSASLGPVTPAQRVNETSLLHRSTKGSVPKGSRTAIVSIVITREDGTYNDGSVDNIELSLTAP